MNYRFFILFLVIIAFGCERRSAAEGAKPRVIATTTMLADMTAEIAGDDFEVVGIMVPGGDPHLYQPTPGDARQIAKAKLVVTSGLHLEGWIDDLVRNANDGVAVAVASEGVSVISDPDAPGSVDPHYWFDLREWSRASKNVEDALVALAPEHEERLRTRGERYRAQTEELDAWAVEEFAKIPRERRVLITSHDAFRYFGRRYDIDVVGIQGISTESEASQRDVANIIELVKERQAPAVFVETSVNPALIEQVARETGAKAAGPLYSDSIGASGTPAETFLGTFKENVKVVVQNLALTKAEK